MTAPRTPGTSALIEKSATPPGVAQQPLAWMSPEAKLWVATRAGEFAGFVEFGDGHYLVTDELGRNLPPTATLREAQSSLDPTVTTRNGSALRTLRVAAIVAAGAATAVLAAALGVIHL